MNFIDSVSIITPSYNSEEYISDTIESVINQSFEDWELIIIDDCSNDKTIQIINSYISKDNRIVLKQNIGNRGAAYSRNVGLIESKYDYVAFLDSDDIWKRDKLEKQLSFMKLNNISFSFTGYQIINNIGEPTGKTVDTSQKGTFSYKDMLAKKATLGCSTVMIDKMSFEDLLEMPSIRTGQDYAFWLKLLRETNKNAYIYNEVLTEYRITPNSISRNKFKKAKRQWFIYRKIEKLNIFKSIYYFCFYAFRAVFRRS